MCELSLYAKLQKLSEDIQLQHSLIAAHKNIVQKSKHRLFYAPDRAVSTEDMSESHAVYVHADKVVQHRAMLVKHYELIRQHKQMVKDQGDWVQHLNTTLSNIQEEKSAVDELMNAKMLENGCRAEQRPESMILTATMFTETFTPPLKTRKYSLKHHERRAHSNPRPSSSSTNSPKLTTPPQTKHTKSPTDTDSDEGPQLVVPPSNESFEASNHKPLSISEDEDSDVTDDEGEDAPSQTSD